jgi:hypothetical protein
MKKILEKNSLKIEFISAKNVEEKRKYLKKNKKKNFFPAKLPSFFNKDISEKSLASIKFFQNFKKKGFFYIFG